MHDPHTHLVLQHERVRASLGLSRAERAARLRRLDRRAQRAAAYARLARLHQS